MMNNYASFIGTLISDVTEFTTKQDNPGWSFRIKVDTGGNWRQTVHCIDYAGDFAHCEKGDTVRIDGALALKKRTVDDKTFYNLSILHR